MASSEMTATPPTDPSSAEDSPAEREAEAPPVTGSLTTSEWGALTSDARPDLPPEPEEQPPDEAPGRPLFPDARPGAGWVPAMGLGALAFLAMLLLAVVVGVVAFLDGVSLGDAAKGGALLFFAFHHVAVRTTFPTFDPAAAQGAEGAELGLGPVDVSFTVSVALLSATLLALYLLYRAGRAAADQGGGSPGLRVAHGAAVAIPYAVLSALLALVVRLQIDVPADVRELLGAGGQVSLSASPLSAFLWPLSLGLAAGGLGALSTIRGWRSGAAGRRLLAAGSGAGRGVLLALLVGFVGLLVLAGLSPDVTASYLGAISDGRSGLILLVFTVLALPNMAVIGGALGMGGSVVAGEYLGATEHVASLMRFPQDLALGQGVIPALPGPAPVEMGMAPVGYFFFILVPIVAAIAAGRRAAREVDAGSLGEGALVGVLAGVLWAAAMVVLGVLAGVALASSVGLGGLVETQGAYLGPHLLLGTLLALAWGSLGGALGGTTATRRDGPPAFEDGVAPLAGAQQPAGTTGFEGLAQERSWGEELDSPRAGEGSAPDDAAAEGEPDTEETPRSSAVELADPSHDEGEEHAPQHAPNGDAAFQFATPATQYGAASAAPMPTEEAAAAETAPPMEGVALPEPEPSPWSSPPETLAAPPWGGSDEAGRSEDADDEAPPEPDHGPEPANETEAGAEEDVMPPAWAPPEPDEPPSADPEPPAWIPPESAPATEVTGVPEPGSASEEPAPVTEEPEAWTPPGDEDTSSETPPPWAPSPDDESGPEEPATPWGGPGSSDPERSTELHEAPAGAPEAEEPSAPAASETKEAEGRAWLPPAPVDGSDHPSWLRSVEPGPDEERPPWVSGPEPTQEREPEEPAEHEEPEAPHQPERAPWEQAQASQEAEPEEAADSSWLFPPEPESGAPHGGREEGEERPPWTPAAPSADEGSDEDGEDEAAAAEPPSDPS